MYFDSAVDKEIEDCFLLNQDTKPLTKKNSPPLVFFLSSTLPTQFASVYAIRIKFYPFGYHSPKSIVPFNYPRIILTSFTCDSFGVDLNLVTNPKTCITS
jgi:hypothetical protein